MLTSDSNLVDGTLEKGQSYNGYVVNSETNIEDKVGKTTNYLNTSKFSCA